MPRRRRARVSASGAAEGELAEVGDDPPGGRRRARPRSCTDAGRPPAGAALRYRDPAPADGSSRARSPPRCPAWAGRESRASAATGRPSTNNSASVAAADSPERRRRASSARRAGMRCPRCKASAPTLPHSSDKAATVSRRPASRHGPCPDGGGPIGGCAGNVGRMRRSHRTIQTHSAPAPMAAGAEWGHDSQTRDRRRNGAGRRVPLERSRDRPRPPRSPGSHATGSTERSRWRSRESRTGRPDARAWLRTGPPGSQVDA